MVGDSISEVGRGSIPIASPDKANQTVKNPISEALPPSEPRDSTLVEKVEANARAAAKNERTTLGKVGNGILRGLAGVAGGALYGTAFAVGGSSTLVSGAALLIISAPFSLLHAVFGKEGAKKEALKALEYGFFLTMAPEALIVIPKAIVYQTVGRLGAGLCAFAATGKRENEQLKGEKFAPRNTGEFSNPKPVRNKSTNEKLKDTLLKASFIHALLDKTRKEHKSEKPIQIEGDL